MICPFFSKHNTWRSYYLIPSGHKPTFFSVSHCFSFKLSTNSSLKIHWNICMIGSQPSTKYPNVIGNPGSVCPSLAPPTPGQPCTLPGELDCQYESEHEQYEHDCCGRCAQRFSCVSDSSTSGAGLWQMSSSPPCPADCCGSEGERWKENCWNIPLLELILLATGEVTSPNYPDNYPNNLEKTDTIQVEQGLILSLQFTAFDVESHSTCDYDHLTITDGDGTTLMEKSCGSTLPANITSTSNIVKLVFITNWRTTRAGWSVKWSAVTSG